MKNTSSRVQVMAVLGLVLTFNYVDRSLLGIVLQSVKQELRLSDTELGFLSGIAFAFFYALMGIPIARWSDKGNRVTLIAITTFLWGGAMLLSGAAQTFRQLLIARVLAAVGEAGCIPASLSIISDLYKRTELPKAMGLYLSFGFASLFIAYFAGGWITQFYGWRMGFILLGCTALPLMLAILTALKEPRNCELRQMPGNGTRKISPNVFSIGKSLWKTPTYRHLTITISLTYFFGFGLNAWQASFFMRSYSMMPGELGTWLTLSFGISGLIGTYLGGQFASRFAGSDEARQLKYIALGSVAFALIAPWTYISGNKYIGFAFVAISGMILSAGNGPLYAAIQSVVPQEIRATAMGVLYFFANLIGAGLGPLFAGMLSDSFHRQFGQESLRYALLCMYPGYIWCAWHIWRASRFVKCDLASVGEPHLM